jgi:hypothetical protein
MAARLKVFVTSDGLTDFVVAATSKPKALAAWGSHQDLFKTGLAHETDDPELSAAAQAQPGEVLRRPAGSRAALAKLQPVKRARPAPKGPSKATLRKVADAERRLAEAQAAHGAALADLEARRETLEARWAAERARLEAALDAARAALP